MSDGFVDDARKAFDAYWSFLDSVSSLTRSCVLDWFVSPFTFVEQLDGLPFTKRQTILAELRAKAPHFLEGIGYK